MNIKLTLCERIFGVNADTRNKCAVTKRDYYLNTLFECEDSANVDPFEFNFLDVYEGDYYNEEREQIYTLLMSFRDDTIPDYKLSWELHEKLLVYVFDLYYYTYPIFLLCNIELLDRFIAYLKDNDYTIAEYETIMRTMLGKHLDGFPILLSCEDDYNALLDPFWGYLEEWKELDEDTKELPLEWQIELLFKEHPEIETTVFTDRLKAVLEREYTLKHSKHGSYYKPKSRRKRRKNRRKNA